MAKNNLGLNREFKIYNEDGTEFYGLVLKKAVVDSVVMSLSDKITGDVYYKDNSLPITMKEYILYEDVQYELVSPPTIVREGMVGDNGDLKGMTKYSFEFYHPMHRLSNIPFSDVATSSDELQYLSESKTFSWIGYLSDFVVKLNKNLQNTAWGVEINSALISEEDPRLTELSEVLSFDKVFISDALKTAYETWEVPFVINPTNAEGKQFIISFGLPSNEIYESPYFTESAETNTFIGANRYVYNARRSLNEGEKIECETASGVGVSIYDRTTNTVYAENVKSYVATKTIQFLYIMTSAKEEITYSISKPFVFKFGQGVGLKNNSRTPKNNQVVTRLFGYGSENNIPYGYPQIRWYGDPEWEYTEYEDENWFVMENGVIQNSPKSGAYPLYEGIVNGERVKLIKHPFTRKHLMPTIYAETLFNKVSPYLPNGSKNPNYNRDLTLVDYYDAVDDENTTYPNPVNPNSPSCEYHEFDKIKPETEVVTIVDAKPYDEDYSESISKEDFLAEVDSIMRDAPWEETLGLFNFKNYLDTEHYEDFEAYDPIHIRFSFKVDADKDIVNATYVSDNRTLNYVVYVGQGEVPSAVWDDSYNVEEDKYPQSYFYVTLPILDYDLYACASIMQEMSIYMRSGDCLGCTFAVQTDWDDYKRNFFDADGNFDSTPHTTEGDGHVRDMTKYPDSRQEQITIIVQKDLNTFGTLMPNRYQEIKGGDEFVVLGISLPLSYITNAQARLDKEAKDFLLENNSHYYEYPLKFDEFFLAQNTNLLEQLNPNVAVSFMFNDVVLKLYVKQITRKYGDAPLPTYDVTLTDDVEVVLNKLGSIEENIKVLSNAISNPKTTVEPTVTNLLNTKLSRMQDDFASGLIGFMQGLWVKAKGVFGIDENGNASLNKATATSYICGEGISSTSYDNSFQGDGFSIIKDENGKWHATFDDITARRKFQTSILEAKKETFVDGSLNLSGANGVVKKVIAYNADNEEVEINEDTNNRNIAYFKLYFVGGDGEGSTIKNSWRVGDMARVQTYNMNTKVGNTFRNRNWWRVVSQTGIENTLGDDREYVYIVVRNDYEDRKPALFDFVDELDPTNHALAYTFDNSLYNDSPRIGDHVVQMGSVLHSDRQGVTTLSSTFEGVGSGGLDVYLGYGVDLSSPAKQFAPQTHPIHIAPDYWEVRTKDGAVAVKDGKILLDSATTEITGDLILKGLLTESYSQIDYEYTRETTVWEYDSVEYTHYEPIIVDMENIKSLVVGAKNKAWSIEEDNNTYAYSIMPSVVVLPFYDSGWNLYAGNGGDYQFINISNDKLPLFANISVPTYKESGTRLSIVNEHDTYLANWDALYEDSRQNSSTENDIKAWLNDVANIMRTMIVICADGRLIADSNRQQIYESNTHAFFAKDNTELSKVYNPYECAYFICDGYRARYLALLPGQSAQLRSQIIRTGEYSQSGEAKERECLIWTVENSGSFTPINIGIGVTDDTTFAPQNKLSSSPNFSPRGTSRGETDVFLGNKLLNKFFSFSARYSDLRTIINL